MASILSQPQCVNTMAANALSPCIARPAAAWLSMDVLVSLEKDFHCLHLLHMVNTLRPRQNDRHFADDIFKCIFLNETALFFAMISLNFVPKGRINKISALVQMMGWHRQGDKPLSEPMMVSLLMHIFVTRPQWVIMSVPTNYLTIYEIHTSGSAAAIVTQWHI